MTTFSDGSPMFGDDNFEPRSIEDVEARIDELRADIENLHAAHPGERFSDADRATWNRLHEERSYLEGTLDELRRRRRTLRESASNPYAQERASTSTPVTRHDAGVIDSGLGTEPHWARSGAIPALWPSEDELRRLHRAARGGQNLRLETRAVVGTGATGADEIARELSTRPRPERRLAVVAGLSAEPVRWAETAKFPVFGSGDANIVAEGALKPEYDSITPGESTPATIALWTDVTRQNLATMPRFASKLRSVLSAKVARREDVLLVATALATTGIQTRDMASANPDDLLVAAGLVASGDVASEPNVAVVHPLDLPAYVGSEVGTGGSASPSFSQFLPDVDGLRLYPSTAITQGQALVGAWSAASHFLVGLAPVFLIDAFSQIKNNVVTVLLEEAVNLAVDEPAGFVHVRPAP